MKREYLVVDDYGMGGLWAVIRAVSKDQIQQKFPSLKVFDEKPSWMSEDRYKEILSDLLFDIDDEPQSWLALLRKGN